MSAPAPVPNNPIFQVALIGMVAKDTPVPPLSRPNIPIVNVWNFIVPGITGRSYNATVQGVGGLGASFYNLVFTSLIAALNHVYVAAKLTVRNLTDGTGLTAEYFDDGVGGHAIVNTPGAVAGGNLKMNTSVVCYAKVIGGRGLNGAARKSFGPASYTDAISAGGPTYYVDRISLHIGDGNTGRNWLGVRDSFLSALSDGVQTFQPFLLSRRDSIFAPPVGLPTIAGWQIPSSVVKELTLTVGSLKARNERARVTAP